MGKKIIFCLLSILFCGVALQAQHNYNLKLDNSSGRSVSDFWETLRKKSTGGIGIGFQKVSFFNALYFSNAQGKGSAIENKGGFEAAYFYHYYPVMVDIGYFRSAFNVNSGSYYPDYKEKSTFLQGLDFYLSYAPLLPDYGRISEILIPFVGIGYQTSSLNVKDTKEDEKIASAGVSSPMWKFGVKFGFGGYFIKGEYKQSLSISKSTAFNAIGISFGYQY